MLKPIFFAFGPSTAGTIYSFGYTLLVGVLLKDVYKRQGWDTHGLPVELEVEKLLGLDGKEQIEEYGLEPVSYTHLDVYKRQVWEASMPVSAAHISVLIFFTARSTPFPRCV